MINKVMIAAATLGLSLTGGEQPLRRIVLPLLGITFFVFDLIFDLGGVGGLRDWVSLAMAAGMVHGHRVDGSPSTVCCGPLRGPRCSRGHRAHRC